MRTLKEINKEISNLNAAIDKLKDEIFSIFSLELSSLMRKYNVTDLYLPVSNHEFNDGDATGYYVNYDCIRLNIKGIDEELDYQDDDLTNEQSKIMEEISDFLDSFTNNDFYEHHFGNIYDEIHFEIKGLKLKTNKE